MSTLNQENSIAIYYEHPNWFRPLFNELEIKGLPFVKLDGTRHFFNLADKEPPYSLFFNRMSPSAYLRNNEQGIFIRLACAPLLKNSRCRW